MIKDKGIVTLPSQHSAAKIIDQLEAALRAKGVTIYARIDQQAEAGKVGSALRPVELLIFGNPKGGAPIMAKEPLAALDLPLKALAWEDGAGKTWLSYNSFDYLRDRYALSGDLIGAIAGVEKLIEQAVL